MSGHPERRDYAYGGHFNRGYEDRDFPGHSDYDRDRPERNNWRHDSSRGGSRSPPRRNQRWRDEESYGSRRFPRKVARDSNILILRGIPRRFSEQEIFPNIADTGADSKTEPKNSAVLRFATVQEACDFISSNPRGLAVQNYHVGLFFGSGHEDGFWSCAKCAVVNHETRSYCLQCGVINKGTSELHTAAVNAGETDVGYTPSHMVLVRGLDTLTSEEELFNAVGLISEVCRVWLVKDRFSRVSCGFGFLEFPSQTVASGFMATLSATQNGYIGLSIGGKWVVPCYSHPQSLIPATEPSPWTVWGTDGAPYQYWDTNLCLSEFPLPPQQVEQANPPPGLSAELEAFDAFVGDTPLNLPGTISAAPLLNLPGTVTVDPIVHTSPLIKTKAPVNVSQPKSLQSSAAPILHAPSSILSETNPLHDKADSESEQVNEPTKEAAREKINRDDVLDYTRLICQLCQRQFREVKDLNKHKDLSQLHKTNLKDEVLVKKVIQSLESKATRYRDRAKEMKLHNSDPKASPLEINEKPTPENIGTRLLSKMGWKEGQGLGKDGHGIREPIKGASYSKGAGVGSGIAIPADQDEHEKYHDRVKRVARSRYLNE